MYGYPCYEESPCFMIEFQLPLKNCSWSEQQKASDNIDEAKNILLRVVDKIFGNVEF